MQSTLIIADIQQTAAFSFRKSESKQVAKKISEFQSVEFEYNIAVLFLLKCPRWEWMWNPVVPTDSSYTFPTPLCSYIWKCSMNIKTSRDSHRFTPFPMDDV